MLPFHGTNSKYKTTGTTLFGKEVQSKLEAVNEKSMGTNICSGFSGGSFSRTSGYYCPFQFKDEGQIIISFVFDSQNNVYCLNYFPLSKEVKKSKSSFLALEGKYKLDEQEILTDFSLDQYNEMGSALSGWITQHKLLPASGKSL
jgi:hypothetical protein